MKADIHVGIEDTLKLIHHEIKHSIKVNRHFGELPEIVCYPGQLNQVYLNLFVNAKQAMAEGGELTVATSIENGWVRIDISDTGKGIRPEHLPKIFDPGFTTKGVGVGTGLGLSIVYQIIQAHHGKITVASEVGVGTTFTILLPVEDETN
jgi:signal transduction histidine kinase